MAYSFHHSAMNSPFEIHIAGQDENYARQAAGAFFRGIDHLENNLSRFLEDSDIARIRLLMPGQVLQVSPETMECLLVALWAYRETQWSFRCHARRGYGCVAPGPGEIERELRTPQPGRRPRRNWQRLCA